MAWKASCILASTREDSYLGTLPAHEPGRARVIVRRLGLADYKPAGPASFEQGVYPPDDGLYVGAYDGTVVLGTDRVAEECLSDHVPPLVQGPAASLPGAKMPAMVLHSVVNLVGYAYYEDGKLVRVRAGSADDGLIIDEGEPLPEERLLLARSAVRGGRRVFLADINGVPEEFTEDAFGEEFVFDLSRRVGGRRLDQIDAWDLKMEKFVRTKRQGLLLRLLGS